MERSPELPGNFAVIAADLPATPPLNLVTDAVPAASSSAFYRLRAEPPAVSSISGRSPSTLLSRRK